MNAKLLSFGLTVLTLSAACDRGSAAAAPPPQAAPSTPAPAPSAQQAPLGQRLRESYHAAASWMVSQQDSATGTWKAGPPGKEQASLAYTALITSALAGAPEDVKAKYKENLAKSIAYITSKQNSDGSFGEGPTGAFLKTYVTGISMMALGLADVEKHKDALRNARGYLKANQLTEGPDRGGLGYGDQEPKLDGTVKSGTPNLSTLGFGAEGMKVAGLPAGDEFWKLCAEYVRRCQNNSEINKDEKFLASLKAKGLSVGDDGGLYYSGAGDPASGPGTVKIGDKTIMQSYGAMTYDGIKTYLYAGLAKDSPEVKAAMDWVRKNYAVETHPGFPSDEKGRQLSGLFYYYLMMARALDAYGELPLKTFDGKSHDWASELGEQLLKIQKDHKMWVNQNPRWWETDPVLVTMYTLNTLDVVLKNVK